MPDPTDLSPLSPILAVLKHRADPRAPEGSWSKCIFVRPRSRAPGRDAASQANAQRWEKVTARAVMLTRAPAVKLVLDLGDRQLTETVGLDAWPARVDALLAEGTRNLHLQGPDRDWHARLSKGGRWLVGRGKLTAATVSGSSSGVAPAPLPLHDRQPNHPLPDDDPRVQALFVATGLFGLNGVLRGSERDKYRQVQHYVELLRPLGVWELAANEHRPLRILDAGCGKAYLSLALYLYASRRGTDVQLTGVDRSPGVLATVRSIASQLGYGGVALHESTIDEFARAQAIEPDQRQPPLDLLVSLHACDTATDDAIVAGAALGARAIVVAPCCQHELVVQLERATADEGKSSLAHAALTGPGLFRHRLADLLTDALRAAALEASGYAVDVLEFVPAEHTARNIMLRAELRPPGPGRERATAKGLTAFHALAKEWGVSPSVRRLVAVAIEPNQPVGP